MQNKMVSFSVSVQLYSFSPPSFFSHFFKTDDNHAHFLLMLQEKRAFSSELGFENVKVGVFIRGANCCQMPQATPRLPSPRRDRGPALEQAL